MVMKIVGWKDISEADSEAIPLVEGLWTEEMLKELSNKLPEDVSYDDLISLIKEEKFLSINMELIDEPVVGAVSGVAAVNTLSYHYVEGIEKLPLLLINAQTSSRPIVEAAQNLNDKYSINNLQKLVLGLVSEEDIGL